ncbi:amino acid ABC transporter substrate-binding protein [Nostoc punctiforme FACHB-252]|uniref:Amino acid ABC transporter substrate-binding protein n=1 Tax=Nostoc punctiforme FACHB-252 TaxID=1357509 RepID=A0ABR8HHP5_NOSPU|nr:ABC transporter substrate-binding protein [Nostoc punctiforme]MBD2614682.1 amino acid ABC transporter substrate-binding protein [Nostoc punctiforme FACHB-252]
MSKTRLEIANERIKSFVERFGKAHLYLAYHAAFPLALTPDLLYCLWVQFQRDIDDQVLGIPWIAVADLLVSSLCNEVGYELYEMDLAVRNELLNRLQEDKKFGQQRINELSNFLLDYVKPKLESKDPDIKDFALTQQWAALAYTQPSKVAHELALEFEKLNHQDIAGLVRMASLTEIFTEPLAEFQPLLIYACVMGKFARGNFKVAKDELRKVEKKGDVIHVAGVSLPIPEQIKPNQKKHKFIARVTSVAGMIVTTLLGVGFGFGVYQWSTPCLASEKKVLGIYCVADPNIINQRISRGDRTLFPGIENSDRDKGIDSLKKANYTEALNYFQEAVKNNRNDPEVLIYYNNALARQKGNSLTLAVVAPAKKRRNSTQEILRGVAQAQNQFNQQNGLQGRLVEIVIADDDNNEDTAKRIAEELVQDKSILGVIGHGSSKVTNTALLIYTKANLAIVSATSSSIELQSSVFFRTVLSDKATGEKLAQYALRNNFKKIVIFCNPVDLYSRSIKEGFRLTFVKNRREEVVPSSCINLADPNLNPAQEVKNLLDDPLVEAIALFPDTEKSIEVAMGIIKTYNDSVDNLRKSNNNVEQLKQIKILAGDSLYKPEVANTLKNLILAVPWFREAPKSQRFAQEAENQWGGGMSWRTATSFDATQAFIGSFKLSWNVSRVTVLENLPKINLSENTSGEPLKFDSSREINKEATLIMVKNGQFVNVDEPN